MKNTPEKDYIHKGWIAAVALILLLLAISVIPPQTVGGMKLRRANILSDLLGFNDAQDAEMKSSLFNEEDFRVDMDEVAEKIDADTAAKQVQTSFEWNIPHKTAQRADPAPTPSSAETPLIPIEDFDTTGRGMQAFYDTLLYARRPVRIAVLGDSFIEGDILTADLREKLQKTYGGGGAGFAPMASPLTAFRRTIKTQSKGWSSYNIMQYKTAPTALRDNFYISGWVCLAGEGASTRWENTNARQLLDSCTSARVFFISPRNSRVELILNDTLRREFTVQGDAAVRQIVVSAPHIHSLSLRVANGSEGFIGYGAVFGSEGVVVDNYSVRSNNGQAMFWSNPSINAQINNMLKYDLVVLQYGLNIMQPGVRNYAKYGQQIEKMVAYVRQCFPEATVLVMGVSDRAVKNESGITPMESVPHMISYQRAAARNTGAAFWSTYEAMRTQGGMERFVANGWAGKDFTHINYAGGRRVAWSLYDALNAGATTVYARAQDDKRRKAALKAVLDSLHIKQIGRQMQVPAVSTRTPLLIKTQ